MAGNFVKRHAEDDGPIRIWDDGGVHYWIGELTIAVDELEATVAQQRVDWGSP
jgi:hypothetical protein